MNFFQIKNENPVYLEKLKNINDQIKNFKDELNENQEIEKEYIGKIERIPGRISRGYIFPPKLLDDVEKALIEFDKVTKKRTRKFSNY